MKKSDFLNYVNEQSKVLSQKLIKEAEANVPIPPSDKAFISHAVLKKQAGEEMRRGIEAIQQNADFGVKAILQVFEKKPILLAALKKWLSKNSENFQHYLQSNETKLDAETLATKLNLPDKLLNEMYQATLTLLNEQKFAEAEAAILLCLTLQPKIFSFWLTYGTIMQKQQEYQSSLYIFQTALIFNENNPMPYVEMAKSWLGLSVQQEAIDCIKKAIELSANKAGNEEFLNYCYALYAYAQKMPKAA